MPDPPKIFISYSHEDKKWLEALQKHLKPLIRGVRIDPWDDTRIAHGAKWMDEITGALEAADVGILLVTPSFLASDFIADYELSPILAKKVVWIAVEACNYKHTELFHYQAANDPSRPLESLAPHEQNKAWVEICDKILKTIANP